MLARGELEGLAVWDRILAAARTLLRDRVGEGSATKNPEPDRLPTTRPMPALIDKLIARWKTMGGQCVDDDGLSEWAADHGPIGKIEVSVEKISQISFTDGPWISRIGNTDEHI